MMERVSAALSRLSERDRRVVLFGGVAAVLLLIVAVLLPLQHGVQAAGQRIAQKRDDLAWLRSVGPQLSALSTDAPAPLRESLVVLIDQTTRDAGIGKSLVSSQPSGDGGLNVRFEQAPFDALVAWLSQLGGRYGVRADAVNIDPGQAAGTVNATLVLHTR